MPDRVKFKKGVKMKQEKKTYEEPRMEIVELQQLNLLCDSCRGGLGDSADYKNGGDILSE